jgi:peptidoglycan hydrolase-like protein with peptidoglycan-binding domain
MGSMSLRFKKFSLAILFILSLIPLTTSGQTSLSRDLSLGSSGSDVSAVQQFLKAKGYLSVESTGYYGQLTQEAVQKWQCEQGIVCSGTPSTTGYGNLGPRSRATLIAESTGGDVDEIYTDLTKNTFTPTSIIAPKSASAYTPPPPKEEEISLSQFVELLIALEVIEPTKIQVARDFIASQTPLERTATNDLPQSKQTTTTQNSITSYCAPTSTTFGIGTENNEVTKLQIFLKQTGDFTYSQITGYYGNVTAEAVQRYQCREMNICNGTMAENGYGLAGPGTRREMCEAKRTQTLSTTYTPPTTTYTPPSTITTGVGSSSGGGSTSVTPTTSASDTSQSTPPPTSGGGGGGSLPTTPKIPKLSSCTLDGVKVEHQGSRIFYSKSSVPDGQLCSDYILSRICTDGTLSGNSAYNKAVCSVNLISDPKIQDNPGYSLIAVHHSFGNCTESGHHHPGPDAPCNNEQKFFAPNQSAIPAYRVTLEAKKGDILRVSGHMGTTNDGNAQLISQELALACAAAMGETPQYSSATGQIINAWASDIQKRCAAADKLPDWWNEGVGRPETRISPSGTRVISAPTSAVVQLVTNSSLIGSRAYQQHGYDWADGRKCDSPEGENCRGHMSTGLSGLYVAPRDGTFKFEIQVSELTTQAIKQLSIDSGPGNFTVEQFRLFDQSNPQGYGLIEAKSTSQQLITEYPPASCPGQDSNTIINKPDSHSVFKLTTQASAGDIIRTFAGAVGLSRAPADTDATALGIWYSAPDAQLVSSFQNFLSGWSTTGTSRFFPYSSVYREGYQAITSSGPIQYRATLHSSDALPAGACEGGVNYKTYISPGAPHNLYGGKVLPNNGFLGLARFTVLNNLADNAMLLREARDYSSEDAQTTQVQTNGDWHTIFSDTFSLAKDGAVRIASQIVLRNMNLSDQKGQVTCTTRVGIPTANKWGANMTNSAYNPTDWVFMRSGAVDSISSGEHRFVMQARCTSEDGRSRIFQAGSDRVYAILELFSY